MWLMTSNISAGDELWLVLILWYLSRTGVQTVQVWLQVWRKFWAADLMLLLMIEVRFMLVHIQNSIWIFHDFSWKQIFCLSLCSWSAVIPVISSLTHIDHMMLQCLMMSYPVVRSSSITLSWVVIETRWVELIVVTWLMLTSSVGLLM